MSRGSYEYEIGEAKRRAAGNTKPYHIGMNHDFEHAVMGPGRSYYQTSMGLTEEKCKQVAELANEAYRNGYEAAQHDFRLILGVRNGR